MRVDIGLCKKQVQLSAVRVDSVAALGQAGHQLMKQVNPRLRSRKMAREQTLTNEKTLGNPSVARRRVGAWKPVDGVS